MTAITSLQIENVKRVKALKLQPSAKGLTVVGGKNGQGKTSVLDAIAWALGGSKMAPSNPKRAGAMNPPAIDIVLDNGIHVKRSGKNSTLTVIDPSGQKAGQQLLDEFVGQFALDLPKFLNANTKEKANVLLQVLGIGDKLAVLDRDEKRLYDERTAVGRIALAKQKHAEELPEYPDVPDEPISISELIKQQQSILAKNGENQAKRNQLESLLVNEKQVREEICRLQDNLKELEEKHCAINADIQTAKKSVEKLEDEVTDEIEASIENIEGINSQVAANLAKQAAAEEAQQYQSQYDDLSGQIEDVRSARLSLLERANLPLPGLAIDEGELVYNGQKWDCMASNEQLRCAVAIVRAVNPKCSFVLMDKLEQLDVETLKSFGFWLEQEGLQVIATRVSTGDECSIIIEDGLPQGSTFIEETTGVKDNDWENF